MSWYEEWFNSPLYEKLYASRNEEEAVKLADLIQDEIPKSRFPNILDLGCGRGRHSITFAKRGYKVTGIDLSEEAIQKARETAQNQGLENVRFVIGDMRQALTETFDAVVNLFTTFGYFLEDEENASVLKSVASMLRPQGRFVIDYLNPDYVEKTLVPSEKGSFSDKEVQIRREIRDGMVYKTMTFTGGELDKEIRFEERVKLYDISWFQKHLKELGFEVISRYGSYEGASYDRQKSPRLILVSSWSGR
ncbi:MAG: methyltransferase domain-containing protein [Bacteroidetes bacterium]|jgi:cyclopropane fatty-acyl-phospholipid synthase-like methyltransferase|nr:methyltransferase domain-containing protein [Bacteroidota bacterium]